MPLAAIDLEVHPETGEMIGFGAVLPDLRRSYPRRGEAPLQALRRFDAELGASRILVGHNLMDHDLPCLARLDPLLALLRRRAIDTLRLNPLVFARRPYHRLIKHHHDPRLRTGQRNDPTRDARLALAVLGQQMRRLARLSDSAPALVAAWHRLLTAEPGADGHDALFRAIRDAPAPSWREAGAALREALRGQACATALAALTAETPGCGWSLAYALAQVRVAGTGSAMPPWVLHRFPEAQTLLKRLRDGGCGSPDCAWCVAAADLPRHLERFFGHEGFRPTPAGPDGGSLQQAIVQRTLAGEPLLAILPTGAGKSVCYQLPALLRHERSGALTVVISPLVALMADQCAALRKRGVDGCVTINGLLSAPERQMALQRIRTGWASMVLMAPEQLRNASVREALESRHIGGWVVDEAHCISAWGHDFRPDFLHLPQAMRRMAGAGPVPPLLCLTATAPPAVRADIARIFAEALGRPPALIDGGTRRDNLDFAVLPLPQAARHAVAARLIREALSPEGTSAAIVYCATRARTEAAAEALRAALGEAGLPAEHFHAGLDPATKQSRLARFREGALRVIVATSAFGMGIDKPDVRLVLHLDIPGSLEAYLQEAGRAGRDGAPARCVLMFEPADIERQFRLAARMELERREVSALLTALRARDRRTGATGVVVLTARELLAEEEEGVFARDPHSDDTRVRTALAWLERCGFLTREDNRVTVYPACLKVDSLSEARARLEGRPLTATWRRHLVRIVEQLLAADPHHGLTTDALAAATGLTTGRLRKALHDLETLGLTRNDVAVTAHLVLGGAHSARRRLQALLALEEGLVALFQAAWPEEDESRVVDLRALCQRLRDEVPAVGSALRPDVVVALLQGLAEDGREMEDGTGSIIVQRLGRDRLCIRLLRRLPVLCETARRRRATASALLRHLEGRAPAGRSGTVAVATTLGDLEAALSRDTELHGRLADPPRALARTLTWLHELRVLTLGRGLSLFRPAMTLRLVPGGRRYTDEDHAGLEAHYARRTRQIHIMAAYALRGIEDIAAARALAADWFALEEEAFLARWWPRGAAELRRRGTRAAQQQILGPLSRSQRQIVADARATTNVLVLAGPGSGKTRVLVHRIAWLIRLRQQPPEAILALAYNRHAAVEIRRRLADLVAPELARRVTVTTCHGLAMRIVGASLAGRDGARMAEDRAGFDALLDAATALLEGRELEPDEAAARRALLLRGYRWILVDEYQDIGPREYALIQAVAGRAVEDEDSRLTLLAVGDDDQNIYAFKGASVDFIRSFEADYRARRQYLVENHRSAGHIIAAANAVIAAAPERMKTGHPVTLPAAREAEQPGGALAVADPSGQGRVQLLDAPDLHVEAVLALAELERLAGLGLAFAWDRAAVIARSWQALEPLRSLCEARGVPVDLARDPVPRFSRLRELRRARAWIAGGRPEALTPAALSAWIAGQGGGPWWEALAEAVQQMETDLGPGPHPAAAMVDWLADWGRGQQRRQRGLLLVTAHGAKGREFDDVVVLGGGWGSARPGEDPEAERRLFYVAMTRARRSLTLMRLGGRHPFADALTDRVPASLLCRPAPGGPVDTTSCRARHVRPGLDQVDLGFAGRLPAGHPSLRAIAETETGAALALCRGAARDGGTVWRLRDRQGRIVGHLARSFRPPAGMTCTHARVAAILERRASDGTPDPARPGPRAHWEVVVPDLVFTPAPAPPPR